MRISRYSCADSWRSKQVLGFLRSQDRKIVEAWRQDYNHVRSFSSLEYRTIKVMTHIADYITGDPAFAVDHDGIIVLWNPAAKTTFGYSV